MDDTIWKGDYCTKCFVKKLRGMAFVWNQKTTKKEKKNEVFDKLFFYPY